MKIRFARPELPALDHERAGTLVLGAFTEERPLRGLAGRVDWRLCGRLSALLAAGRLEVELGEALLCPTGGRLPFDRLLVVGLGSTADFDAERYAQACHLIAWKLARMNEPSFAMQLPGLEGHEISLQAAARGWRHGMIRSFDSPALASLSVCILADDSGAADLRAPLRAVADEINQALRHELEREAMANAPPMPEPMATATRPLALGPDAPAPSKPRASGVIRLGPRRKVPGE